MEPSSWLITIPGISLPSLSFTGVDVNVTLSPGLGRLPSTSSLSRTLGIFCSFDLSLMINYHNKNFFKKVKKLSTITVLNKIFLHFFFRISHSPIFTQFCHNIHNIHRIIKFHFINSSSYRFFHILKFVLKCIRCYS